MDADGDQGYGGGHRRRLEGVEKIATLSYLPAGMNPIMGLPPKELPCHLPGSLSPTERDGHVLQDSKRSNRNLVQRNRTVFSRHQRDDCREDKYNFQSGLHGLTRQSRGE